MTMWCRRPPWPLARAFDLFEQLLDQQQLRADTPSSHAESGVAYRLNRRCRRQNGQASAQLCRRHYDNALATDQRVSFVWDLVNARTAFEDLSCIFDAGKAPTLPPVEDDHLLERKYGLPKRMSFGHARRREASEIDWFSGVY